MIKKGGLNFLNRRNQSLFDTNVQMKDIGSVEGITVYDTVVIPDSGTAQVRSRPTVKHFTTFGDGAGLAVPTPTVPVLPSTTTPQISHSGNSKSLSNGGTISVNDLREGQILIPPPPSIAPPPPPPQFIPPPPLHIATPPSEFFGEPYAPVDLSTLEPPSMPPPMPPSKPSPLGMSKDVDLSAIRPPPMAPPKPPNYQIAVNSHEDIPECPKFTPPLPPTEKPDSPTIKVHKIPPSKPSRFSSIPNLLSSAGSTTPPSTPSGKRASNFDSSHTGKLYTVPKPAAFTSQPDKEKTTQHSLVQVNSSKNPSGAHINGKTPVYEKEISVPQPLVPPVKPLRRNSSGILLEQNLKSLKENMKETQPNLAEVDNSTAVTVNTLPDVPHMIPTQITGSPHAEKTASVLSSQDILHLTPVDPERKYSPLLDRKLQNLKTNESSPGKEAATSPLALLMAAKKRDKQKASLSRQNSSKSTSSTDFSSVSIHPSDTRPNSFTVTPKLPISTRSVNPSMKPTLNAESPKMSYSRPEPSVPSSSKLSEYAKSPSGQHNGFDALSFIPPPPEFANNDPEDETPPSVPPPAMRTDFSVHQNIPAITDGPTNSPSIKTSIPTIPYNVEPSTQFKQPQAQLSSLPKIQPQVLTPSFPKSQPQPSFPSQLKTQPQVLTPSFPKSQPQPPFPSQLKTQAQSPTPSFPKSQPHSPFPSQLKTQAQSPTPSFPKTQTQASPPPHPQFKAPLPPLPKAQPQAPPLPKIQPQPPPPSLPKIQPHAPPPSLPKTQSQPPPSAAASQATLLSILQKKMLEMGPKFAPADEDDAGSDDWNSPQFDEEETGGFSPNPIPKPKSSTSSPQSAGLNMKELENKIIKKTPARLPVSGSSKQQFGMTFMVRPGSKQPITPVPKFD